MRLIDADTLIKDLGFLYTKNRVPNVPIDMRAQKTLTTIMEQPTAYDVDKVVKEINEWTFNANIDVGDGTVMNHNLIVRDTAIEIVKAGATNES